MGYNVQAYAVDVERLRSIVGSGDDALVDRLRQKYAYDLENVDDISDEEPSAADALTMLVHGRMEDGEVNFKYGYALELICRETGTWLPNQCWSATRSEFFDSVDGAFESLGGSGALSSMLFWSGAPLDLPFIDDFPAIGSLLRDRVRALREELERLLAVPAQTDEIRALGEVLEWLRTAENTERALVTFYY